MVDRTVRVAILGDSTSLVSAAGAGRTALMQMANVNLGTVSAGMAQASSAAKEAGESSSKFGEALETGLGIVGIEMSFTGIVDGFKSIVAAGMEYQASLNTLAAVTGSNTDQMAEFSKKAKDLGADISIPGASASSAAAAMAELAKGGLKANEVLEASRGTMLLAAAAQIDGAEAAKIQASALNAFRLSADQAGHVADVLANAANAASGEITDMAAGLQQSATVAAGFGIGIDETTTTLALFAKNGIIGSDAGTSFKTMLQQLASPTNAQRQAMDDLNLTIYDQAGRFIGMKAVTDQLSQAHKRMTTEQYNSAASTLFGTDAIRAANILGQEGIEGWDEMSKAVRRYDGAALLAAAQTAGLNGKVDAFNSTVNSATVALFEKLQPGLMKIADAAIWLGGAVGKLIDFFGLLPSPIQAVSLSLVAMVALRTPLVAMAGGIGAGFAAMGLRMKAAILSPVTGFQRMNILMSLARMQAAQTGVAFNALGARAIITGQLIAKAFIANPLGILLVGLTTVISLWSMFSSGADDAADAQTDFNDVVDEGTGILKENADVLTLQKVQGDGTLALWQKMTQGVLSANDASSMYTYGILGNKEAGDQFSTTLLNQTEAALKLSTGYQYMVKDGRIVNDVVVATGKSTRQLASDFLASGDAGAFQSSAMRELYQIQVNYASATNSVITKQKDVNSEIQVTTNSAYATQSAIRQLASAMGITAEQAEDLEKGVAKVHDELGAEGATLGFKVAIDKVKVAAQQAQIAAEGMGLALLEAAGSNLDGERAARASAAAMRMVTTAARNHEAALADVAEKQQVYDDLVDHGTLRAGELEDAQKSADDASRASAEAQTELLKAQQKAAEDLRKAQEDLQKAKDAAWRKEQDAKDALPDIQAKADRDMRDAQEALAAAQADPKSTAIELRDAQEKVADTAKTSAQAVKDAQDKIASAHDEGADSVKSAEERVQEAQASGADAVAQAQQRITDAAASAAEAQTSLQEVQERGSATSAQLAEAHRAVQAAEDAVASSADAMADANDKAGEAARNAAAAAAADALAKGDEKGATDAATAALHEQREAFIQAQIATGKTREEAEKLADQQGLIERNIPIIIDNASIVGAQTEVQHLNEMLKEAGLLASLVYITGPDGKPRIMTKQESDDINNKYKNLHPDGNYYDYGMGVPSDKAYVPIDPNHYGDAPGDLHADGGFITGPGGPRDDKIPAPWLSNGEFVVNAAATDKWRWFLEMINGKGYADGGEVAASAAPATAAAQPTVTAAPDAAAWSAISAAMVAAWNEQMLPVFDSLTLRNLQLGKEFQTLSKDWATPHWTAVGTTVQQTWATVIEPTYTMLNDGTRQVADTWRWLHTDMADPHFIAIGRRVVDTWNGDISPTYNAMNQGSDYVGATFATLANTTATTWTAIGATITGVYNTAIVPAWTGVQGFVTSMVTFFGGAQTGMTTAATSVTTDLATITTKIDEFFKMVDTKAPVAAPAATAGATPATVTVPVNAALADGGPITMGTTGRADDVIVAVSKGEYVVNAKAAAAHRSELDAMNFGGAYADGGMVGEKIGNRIGTNILDGAQRAIEAGVTRVMASVAPAYTTTGDGGAVTLLTNEGTRGRFLAAVASQMGLEYVWGGDSPPNFDCSGLMSWALREAGTGFGRFTAANFSDSYPNFPTGEKPGDMAIFDTGRVSPKAGHIGAVMDPVAGTMMHTDGAGPSRVSPYRGRSGLMGFIDPIGTPYVPSAPAAPTGTAAPKPGDPPAGGWVGKILAQIAKGGTMGTGGTMNLLTSAPGVYGTTRLMNTVDPTTDFGPMNMARGTAEMVGPVPAGGATERWRPLYAQAMNMLGKYSEPGLEKMMYQMFRESSGNPLSYAIDSNYDHGHPSKGLLQTIPGTFKAHAPAGYNTNIWDPLSNALASLNYIGDPLKYPGGAYANGGIVGTDTVPARLTPGEAVISPFSAYKDKQKNLVSHAASWFGGEVSYPDARSMRPVINVAAPQVQVFIGNEEITGHVEVVVDGKLANVAAKVNRMGAQG